jgi:GTP-binding protein HflX
LKEREPHAISTSALTGEGTEDLLRAIAAHISRTMTVTLEIPAARGDLIARLYRDGTVLSTEVSEESMLIRARLPRDKLPRYSSFLAGDAS